MSSSAAISSASSSVSASLSAIGSGDAVVDAERIHRVELLRAELDRSLKVAAAAAQLNSVTEKRSPLCILFRAADSVHIQFSGSTRSSSIDLFARPSRSRSAAAASVTASAPAGATASPFVGSAAVSRFTVSPTPNAVPPAAALGASSTKCNSNNNGTTTGAAPASPWSLTMRRMLLSASTTNANRNRQNDNNGGCDAKGCENNDGKCHATAAAIAAAELLAAAAAPPPRTTSVDDKDGNKDNKMAADFVMPPIVTTAAAVSTAAAVGAASSPASSVDSGVASPGADGDFLLGSASFRRSASKEEDNSRNTTGIKLEQYNSNDDRLDRVLFDNNNSPCWATVPRTRRRIFNFCCNTTTTSNIINQNNHNNNGSPLIDALALSTSTPLLSMCSNTTSSSSAATAEMVGKQHVSSSSSAVPLLTLQRPPLKKKYGPAASITDQSPEMSSSSFLSNSDGYTNNTTISIMDTVATGSLLCSAAATTEFSVDASAKLDIISSSNNNNAGDGKEDNEEENNTTTSPRRTPLSVVQMTTAAVQRQLSDSVCSYNNSSSSDSNENCAATMTMGSGADSDTALDTTMYSCGLPPRAATVPPLRSILKKPRTMPAAAAVAPRTTTTSPNNTMVMMPTTTEMPMMMTTMMDGQRHMPETAVPPLPRNHLRRVPSRIVLERSVSDSLLDDVAIPDDRFSALQHSAATAFNASILRKLSMPSAASPSVLGSLDEQLEDTNNTKSEQYQPNNSNSTGNGGDTTTSSSSSSSSSSCPSSCSSETIDTDGSGQSATPAPIAKKRVSFSECVHARYFRSNSSILGQRKKNEKKARKRTSRRCNSDVVHPSDEVSSSSLSQLQQYHDDCDESCPWIVWKHRDCGDNI